MSGASEDLLLYGGQSTLQSYMNSGGAVIVPPQHVDFLGRTQVFLDTPGYLFVHGGMNPRFTIRQNLSSGNSETFMYYKEHLRARRVAWEECVVFGHTPVPEPILMAHMIGLDTGCMYAGRRGLGRLTAIRLPGNEVISVFNCESQRAR